MSDVSVSQDGPRGMITLKGDLADLSSAVTSATGCAMPGRRAMTQAQGRAVAWMAPDEVLILCDHAEVGNLVMQLSDALVDQTHLAVDVSDARALFTLDGPGAREVLARLSPTDQRGLEPGEMRRTRMAQVPAAVWFNSSTQAQVICFRSVATYMHDILHAATRSTMLTGQS
ncbi:sarcosine oxidase subunit gamma [Jannaschia sp. CCS1]|uniref:sarcosine oxidase subunit gamma n=1 Tax=Jannaschia sp. (strain CCS1) TaxID=290400 RepID=UPI000053B97E|nr:sarcosine oxidase subunit gamma family protein [Jannaschia sp. CCS1]ABD55104.1 Sarcosine oxidase gamma subunit [Jannaschia sp. CCS1]